MNNSKVKIDFKWARVYGFKESEDIVSIDSDEFNIAWITITHPENVDIQIHSGEFFTYNKLSFYEKLKMVIDFTKYIFNLY